MRRTVLALPLILAVTGASADDGNQDISHVNGGIVAEAGQHYGDLETVNGGIRVRNGASADDVETVNGSITLGDDADVGSAQTVNGGITAGERVKVRHDLETVNGGIRLDFNSRVGGDVATVNGGITVKQSDVGGRVQTVGGDITIGTGSHVHRGVLVEKPSGIAFRWGKQKTPRIVIGPGAIVDGELRFERDVELFVHPTAKIGPVIGAKAQSWTDKLPARL